MRCDGGADLAGPHVVYLIFFPALSLYKVGITHSQDSRRISDHLRNGAEVISMVAVKDRLAAFRVERAVLVTTAAFRPTDSVKPHFAYGGWTETWTSDAPAVDLHSVAAAVLRN
ncbi:hypothetical protein GCM10010532_056410 [Dactylosporangium siamense]|uniref:Uncharacterized protein n=1 Tax=Dactylosporangium siamense TaxID=685454 RepID=A0A919U7U5_9ACTN|nr:hypothetical protein Dsi01nite_039050 [Dactylosporangium siamense]